MKTKVIVIGDGISGLSAGIYALRCGFNVTILESHSMAGGICTSWGRKGYLFEGGMHWLAGSNKNEAVNKLWRHVGALDDNVAIRYSEPFLEYGHNGASILVYRDIETTERGLIELSPADAKEIRRFCNNIRKLKGFSEAISDLRGVKVTKKKRAPLSMFFSLISVIGVMNKYAKISREQYANRFLHEGIREMLRSIPGDQQGIAMFFMTMGSLARGDGGFPEGGSLPFAGRMVKAFTALGGQILYNTRAERVIVEDGRAVGVLTGGKRMDAGAVIITADTMAIERLFEAPLKSPWLDRMRRVTGPTMVTFISLGINADLKKYNNYYIFKLKNPIVFAGQKYEYLSVSNYAADPAYSPEGKTAMTVQLPGDTYDFWKKAKEDDTYEEKKQKIADEIIAAITAQMPEARGQIEVCDVATPLTYERYCGCWKGSWMTEIKPDMKFKPYPAVIKGLDCVYFAGQRMNPPGGLPAALMSGRAAVQYLCRETDTLFISEE